jgi:hypothetical protein
MEMGQRRGGGAERDRRKEEQDYQMLHVNLPFGCIADF